MKMKTTVHSAVRVSLLAVASGLPGALSGQSVAPAELLRGRTADVRLAAGGLTGELLAFHADTLWIGAEDGLRGIPRAELRQIRVHRHGMDGSAVLRWSLIGAGVSTVGMTLACSRVEDTNCAAVAGVTLLSWGFFAGIFGSALAGSSRQEVPASPEGLRPWVRYPGGLPPSRRTSSTLAPRAGRARSGPRRCSATARGPARPGRRPRGPRRCRGALPPRS